MKQGPLNIERGDEVSAPSLAANALWNLAGQVVPLGVGIFSIPVLVAQLGVARFGLLTIAWLLIGYMGLFDLGLGRAVTRLVAEPGDGRVNRVSAFRTAQVMLLVLGILGGLAMIAAVPFVILHLLRVPPLLEDESVISFRLLALSLPFVTLSTGYRGYLEGLLRFDVVNWVRIPIGILTFLAPVVGLAFGHSLVPAIVSLVLVRLATFGAYAMLAERRLRSAPASSASRRLIGPLVAFGGWITVSSIVGPLMVSLDRFVIGVLISVESVAYYATPYEVATKLWVLPSSVAAVLFPAFSMSVHSNPSQATTLFLRSLKYMLLVMYPVVLFMVLFAVEGLRAWLGPDFASRSAIILQLISIGVLFNSFAHIPFALIQGSGRPDVTAKLHFLELPIYGLGFWLLVQWYGLPGAALAWLLRVVLDAIALNLVGVRILKLGTSTAVKMATVAALAAAGLCVCFLHLSNEVRATYYFATLVTGLTAGWFMLLDHSDRRYVLTLRLLRRRTRPI